MNPFDVSAQLAARPAGPRRVREPQIPIVGKPATPELFDLKVADQIRAYKNAVYKGARWISVQVAKLKRTVVEVQMEKDKSTGKLKETRTPQPQHAVTRMLGKGARAKPNPWTTSGNYLAQIVIDLCLTGNFFGLKVRDNGGRPVWSIRLRPDWTRILPDDRQGITGYTFRPLGQNARPLIFDRSEILHIKLPSPLDPRVGWSPLRSMAYGADLGDQIRRFQRQFFEQGAHVDGIIQGVQNETEVSKVYDLLVAGHYRGADSAWLPLVLPKGLQFTPTQQTNKDFEFAALADFSDRDVLEGFGVPPALLGNVKDVNRANLQGLMIVAAENAIKPMTSTIEEHVEADLLTEDFPSPSNDRYLEFDFEDPTPGDPDQERMEDEMALKTGGITINEWREKKHLQPVDWGERPWFGFGLVQPLEGENTTGGGSGGGDGGNGDAGTGNTDGGDNADGQGDKKKKSALGAGEEEASLGRLLTSGTPAAPAAGGDVHVHMEPGATAPTTTRKSLVIKRDDHGWLSGVDVVETQEPPADA